MNTPDTPVAGGDPWTCPNCQAPVGSAFCPACGERHWRESDLRFRHLLEQLLESLIHFDGRLARTARTLVAAPGRLTQAYVTGARQPYVGPVSLFLAANLVFFLVQTFSGLSVFTISLHEHLTGQIYRALAERWVTAHLAATGLTMEHYAPVFDHAGDIYAKSLVMVMLPFFAIAVGLLFVDRRKVAVAHLVFAIHFYAFLMVFLSVLFPVLTVLVIAWIHLGLPRSPHLLDMIVLGIEGIGCLTYLARAAGVAYDAGPIRRWLSAAALTVATLYILYLYRFILFAVTLWTT